MKKPLLSIITITYNNPHLYRTLESVIRQEIDKEDIEHIIVDNLSNDGSDALVNEYIWRAPYKVTYLREKDSGRYDAMNKGIKLANGEYLSFMNAGDHFFDSRAVKKIIDFSGGRDIIYGNVNVVNKSESSVYKPPDTVIFSYFLNGYALPHQASIIKKKLFETIGLYDESLKIIADWKFFLLALCKFNCTYVHLNETIATYYFDGISSMKENSELINEDKNKVFSECFSSVSDLEVKEKNFQSQWTHFDIPVLFIIFNRLDTTKRVFEEIKKVKPDRLYIASDGPRDNKPNESKIVSEIRAWVLNSIDWNCQVKTLFRERNLGCGRAVATAITWFFDNVEEGIILEDDCLPNQSFFLYCKELLLRYRDNKKIMHISGDQFVPDFDNGASYYFARNMHCWGWASWSDRWKYYRYNLSNYDEKFVLKVSTDEDVRSYWQNYLKRMKNAEIDTWDYQWTFAIFARDGLCINPSKNLISNIGFGSESTNGFRKDNPNINLRTFSIDRIIHPQNIQIDENAVEYIFRVHYGICREKVIKESIKSVIFRMFRWVKKYIYGQ